MSRDPCCDILFEPAKISPVTTKNRSYQVPHCTGMGWVRQSTLAEMRGVKAEGGWGVVHTEYGAVMQMANFCNVRMRRNRSIARSRLRNG